MDKSFCDSVFYNKISAGDVCHESKYIVEPIRESITSIDYPLL